MAGKKNEKPAQEEKSEQGRDLMENGKEQFPDKEVSAGDQSVNPSGKQPEKVQGYHIICRNKVTKNIGGVDFVDGVGYTEDAFEASWFASKEGYTVNRAQ